MENVENRAQQVVARFQNMRLTCKQSSKNVIANFSLNRFSGVAHL